MKLWKMLLFVAIFGTTVLISCDNAETPEQEDETITKITDDTTGAEADTTNAASQDTIPADTMSH